MEPVKVRAPIAMSMEISTEWMTWAVPSKASSGAM